MYRCVHISITKITGILRLSNGCASYSNSKTDYNRDTATVHLEQQRIAYKYKAIMPFRDGAM